MAIYVTMRRKTSTVKANKPFIYVYFEKKIIIFSFDNI